MGHVVGADVERPVARNGKDGPAVIKSQMEVRGQIAVGDRDGFFLFEALLKRRAGGLAGIDNIICAVSRKASSGGKLERLVKAAARAA